MKRWSAAGMRRLVRTAVCVTAVTMPLFGYSCDTATEPNEDGTVGTPDATQVGPYWSRNDGAATAYLYLSGTTAKACAGGEETIGTYQHGFPNATMTFVIEGDRLVFPLEYRDNSLLVGVPNQGKATNNPTWYVRSTTYDCANGGGGGGDEESTTGRITFYTKLSEGGAITIEVDGGVVGVLDQYFTSGEPDCEQTDGVVSLELQAGTYDFYAEDEEGSYWEGTVEAEAGSCTLYELT